MLGQPKHVLSDGGGDAGKKLAAGGLGHVRGVRECVKSPALAVSIAYGSLYVFQKVATVEEKNTCASHKSLSPRDNRPPGFIHQTFDSPN